MEIAPIHSVRIIKYPKIQKAQAPEVDGLWAIAVSRKGSGRQTLSRCRSSYTRGPEHDYIYLDLHSYARRGI